MCEICGNSKVIGLWYNYVIIIIEQAICFFFPVAYYSPIGKKNIYLNSGLTSTKNYGKTILTKVCSSSFKRVDFEFIVVGPQQLHIYVDIFLKSNAYCSLSLPKQIYVFSDKYEKYKEEILSAVKLLLRPVGIIGFPKDILSSEAS